MSTTQGDCIAEW